MKRSSVSIVERPGWSGRPSARATATGTRSGSMIGARSTYHTPSRHSPIIRPATSKASRVLPTPPAPVNVTSRLSARIRRTSVISAARPTKLVSCTGRRWATTVFAVRSGGNSTRRSGWHSCTTRSGRGRSRSRWVPRSVSQASGAAGRQPSPRSCPTAQSGRRAPHRAAAPPG